MTKTKTLKVCSICGGPIGIEIGGWADGHNAEPVNHGRCCSACNEQVVIPMRIQRMLDHLPMHEVRQE